MNSNVKSKIHYGLENGFTSEDTMDSKDKLYWDITKFYSACKNDPYAKWIEFNYDTIWED